MATQTTNLNLTLPDGTDQVDVSVLNENYQKIDDNAGGGTTPTQTNWANVPSGGVTITTTGRTWVLFFGRYDSTGSGTMNATINGFDVSLASGVVQGQPRQLLIPLEAGDVLKLLPNGVDTAKYSVITF